jgi:uncharacterized membrane protein
MESQDKQNQMAVSIPATKATLLIAIAIALVLLLIGVPVDSEWPTILGAFVLSLASFWGGLFLTSEHVAVRAVLVAVGGLVAMGAFIGLSTANLSSLFGM